MIVQILNSKILANISDLDNVVNPKHGDAYFVNEDKKVYSFYNSSKNDLIGKWGIDSQIVIYNKDFVLNDGFTDVTQYFPNAKTLIEDEAKIYLKRIYDGKMMSINLMSELRVNSQQNNLPRTVNAYIEQKLENVKINIDRGWWVTALEQLELTVVELYFTQELYDRLHLTISTYISENY